MSDRNIFEVLENSSQTVIMNALGVNDSCPSCKTKFSEKCAISLRRGDRIRCQHCSWVGTWRSDTMLKGSHLSSSQFLFLLVLLKHGVDVIRVANFLGVDSATVRSMQKKIESADRLVTI